MHIEGHIYMQDAFKVLQVLRQWTTGGSNNNIQDAWVQLLQNYEDMMLRVPIYKKHVNLSVQHIGHAIA
jgi:hypothetical protein